MKKINKTITAGGIIMNEYNEVVIVNQNHDSWSLPKGHIDPGESPLEAALREISPHGVDASSKLEKYPGIKDINKVKSLLNIVKDKQEL